MVRMVSPFVGRSVPEWIEILQRSSSVEERYRALLAIISLGNPDDALQWCRRSLCDADSAVRSLAAKQLGELKRHGSGAGGDPVWSDVAMELAQRLTDSDSDVRFEAARAIGRIRPGDANSRDVLMVLLNEQETQPLMLAAVVAAIAESHLETVAPLLERYRLLLSHEQAEVREEVSAAVAKWDADAKPLVDELVIAIDDDEPIVRENAAVALGHARVDSGAVRSALRSAATDEDEGVAAAARHSLSQLDAASIKHS